MRRPSKLLHAIPDATGVLHRWEASLNPVVDASGEVTHVVEVWRDITDRSQLEGQLAHSERLASLGMLAAGVAHEINNPMASIVAGVESLKRWLDRVDGLDADQADEAIEVLDLVERETLRSREITDKLLLLAQPYSGVSTWVDVNRAGRDTISLLNYQLRKQDISVEEQLDARVPPIWGRESGIRGIWMNLCMNAVQAMRSGGTLTVRSEARLHSVAFEVIDTGPGIPRQHLDRIWDPFFTTKPPGEGTGLGLSITQRSVHRHGGTIEVHTAPGQGARFTVELPHHGPGGERV
jgi:signal transduction histidine kinase